MTVFDEDFTEDDMQAALDYDAAKALRCSCGGFLDETTAVGADDNYEAEVIVCHRCAARDRTERAFLAQDNAVTAGLKVRSFEAD